MDLGFLGRCLIQCRPEIRVNEQFCTVEYQTIYILLLELELRRNLFESTKALFRPRIDIIEH